MLLLTVIAVLLIHRIGLINNNVPMLPKLFHSYAYLNTGGDSQQWSKHNAYRKALDPDDWQTVDENISYAYSAHLNPDSSDTESLVQIIGAMRVKEIEDMTCTFRQTLQCQLWWWSRGANEPTVDRAKVDQIKRISHKTG